MINFKLHDYDISLYRKLAINKYFSKMSQELSFSILNSCSMDVKNVYRKVENSLVNIVKISSHLCFNETCVNNNILPTYTNIYIYIYIYIYINIY